ncbi:hypothetical protein [Candidatus Phytoplasma melaleucae]|uniref:Uncharacterized protein n=1 Tax=Candidatus Phytoplasma melaleucae TaxID=2982630 RepID=A0ABT9DDY6_9MOLU|nr:hypothetical protein ['Melaleuca sp.' phytoplasma]MDO8168224.1 hypothetical protein ['Melaleuca sp.' phytoplasma]MDV3205501.1 hypothetical protein [Weeping tea tree witches'-broom phytoplasma]
MLYYEMQIPSGDKISFNQMIKKITQKKNLKSIQIQEIGGNFFNKDSYKRIEIKNQNDNIFFIDIDDALYLSLLNKITTIAESEKTINITYKMRSNYLSSILLSLSILCAALNVFKFIIPIKIKNWFNDILPSP